MRVGAILPPSQSFERAIAVLEKKYPAVRGDVAVVVQALPALSLLLPAPPSFVLVPGLGRAVLKVRAASTDAGRGKSGGYRVLLAHVDAERWCPFLVYSKSQYDNPPRALVLAALKET